jgi:hypothetical protein
MPDQENLAPAVATVPELSAEVGSSLASVWARYVGARPSKAETQLDGSVVRWLLAEGTREFEEGMSVASEEDGSPRPERTMAGYKRETAAAVAKVTHRRVVAMMSDHDSKTGIATETFILEGPRKY